MKSLALALILTTSFATTQVHAGPSGQSDKVLTGLIVGATAAALITALAHADEVNIYSEQPKPKRYHGAPHHKPHPKKHWRQKNWHHRNWRDNSWHKPERHYRPSHQQSSGQRRWNH